MSYLIALLTDFGLKDPYVAEVKATLVSYAPNIQIIDISHQIPSFDILSASFVLYTSYHYFPANTLFVGIIDPGVGSEREIILAKTSKYSFLVPNNGLLSFFIWEKNISTIFKLNTNHFVNASTTFHGRDIFAPIAAKIITDSCPSSWWEKFNLSDLISLKILPACCSKDKITATICYIDKFGNVILNLENKKWSPKLEQKGTFRSFPLKVVQTYSQLAPNEVGILPGSHGFVELCLNQDNLAKKLNLTVGESIEIYF
ncbi:SAM hydrolase/SAM-dependent halogenase family protein [Desulfonauticus submarinus]